MYMPRRYWSSSGTAVSPLPFPFDAAERSTPLLATRSRPRFIRSRAMPTSSGDFPSARSFRFSASNVSAYGVGMHRIAWPGPVSSSTVSPQASASFWNRAVIAPASTASVVNRYAVPISTPTFTPFSARDALSAATMLAESASWMPPAKTTCSSSAVLPVACSARASAIVSHSAKLARGPTCPPHSCPSKTNRRAPSLRNIRNSPGDGTCR